MEPYSIDLRERVVAACNEGVDTRAEVVHDTDAHRRELWQKLTSGTEWSSPSGTVRQLLTRGDPANIPSPRRTKCVLSGLP